MLTPVDSMENAQKTLLSWYPNFDLSLIIHYCYVDYWNNYDCSGFLMVFLGVDGTYQMVQEETNPFSSCEDNVNSCEVSETVATSSINSFKKTVESVDEDDSHYGVF